VRRIFHLSLRGDGQSGPMGVKAITGWLNSNGYTSPRGGQWSVGPVHQLLTATRFIGFYERTGGASAKFESSVAGQVVRVECPAIISQDVWDAVQSKLKAHNPKVAAPRIVAADHMLTGTSKCACCAGPLIVTTGKSGRYRYYSCSTFQTKGREACREPSRIPVDELNDAVLEAVLDQVIEEERLASMLNGLAERQNESAKAAQGELVRLEKEKLEADAALLNLQKLVEKGLEDVDDELFAGRYRAAKDKRAIANESLSRARKRGGDGFKVTPERIARFSRLMRTNLTSGDNKFRRTYLSAIIEKVVVRPDAIHITGRKEKLSGAVAEEGDSHLISQAYAVPSCMNEWRTRQDSNL
jgi:site-specific DNA recombinase